MTDTWTWEPIARHDVITEGPAWDGEGLRYTEIDANRLWRYTPADGRREVWRSRPAAPTARSSTPPAATTPARARRGGLSATPPASRPR